MRLTDDDEIKIADARRKAYVEEKVKIEKAKGREKARWENLTFLEKCFKVLRGLFGDD
jgi:hypothetical protein